MIINGYGCCQIIQRLLIQAKKQIGWRKRKTIDYSISRQCFCSVVLEQSNKVRIQILRSSIDALGKR